MPSSRLTPFALGRIVEVSIRGAVQVVVRGVVDIIVRGAVEFTVGRAVKAGERSNIDSAGRSTSVHDDARSRLARRGRIGH